MKRCILLLVGLLAVVCSGLTVRSAKAQTFWDCEDSSATFPTGWSVRSGITEGSPGDQYVWADGFSSIAELNGVDFNAVIVNRYLFGQTAVGKIGFIWYYSGIPDVSAPVVTATLYLRGAVVTTRNLPLQNLLATGWSQPQILDFGGAGGDAITFTVAHLWIEPGLGGHPENPLALKINSFCRGVQATYTPQPTFPYPTEVPTRTPTNVPTATGTPTPLPTNTPGGPTDTPVPDTSTPAPTGTATLEGFNSGSAGLFSTVGPADDCDPYVPCEALPWPVPGFATPNLSSPIPYTQVAVLPTVTPGTPSVTVTPIAPAGLVDYATQVGGIVAGIGGTPGLHDAEGDIANLSNATYQVGAIGGQFMAIVRAIQNVFLGKVGTIITVLILLVLFIVIVRLVTMVPPIIGNLIEKTSLSLTALSAVTSPLLIVVLLVGFVLTAGFGLVKVITPPAATSVPAATPTLKPILPTPTSGALYLHATPTPFVLPTLSVEWMPAHIDPNPTADLAINMYRWLNTDHMVDLAATAVLIIFGVRGLVRFAKTKGEE